MPPFNISKIGQWGSRRDDGVRKELEIDIATINNDTKHILFVECKWKDNIDAKKIIDGLKEKTEFVDWHNNNRNEYYAVFAKSFKERMTEPSMMLFDLIDIEKAIY